MTQPGRGRIETAFEISRVFISGERWRDSAAWCPGCESYVPVITAFVAAALDKTTSAEIFRRVEAGELHHRVTADGQLLVCLSSLLDIGETATLAAAAATA